MAVDAEPPAYPDVTCVTPRTCLKTASTPQKHPPANTAARWLVVAVASGASTAGSGRTTAELAAVTPFPAQPTLKSAMRAKRPHERNPNMAFSFGRISAEHRCDIFPRIPIFVERSRAEPVVEALRRRAVGVHAYTHLHSALLVKPHRDVPKQPRADSPPPVRGRHE